MNSGQQLIPYKIQFNLHVVGLTGDRDHSILVRHDNDELAVGPVRSEGIVSATPDQVAVSLPPVTGIPWRMLGPYGSLVAPGSNRCLYPRFRQYLPAIPFPFLQVQLPE